LKGTALDCFESAILDPIKPPWLSDFNLFLEELEANFGTYDPVGEAEAELKGLRMHESHQATKYFITFQQLATCIEWGNAALCRQNYNGLTKHIKDDCHDLFPMLSPISCPCSEPVTVTSLTPFRSSPT